MTNQAEQLLIAIAAGQTKAMETFYRQFHQSVYRFALKIAQNDANAAEIMNEVMLEVWRKADTFSGRSKVSTWVLGITHHKAIDLLRKQKRHQAEDIDEQNIEASCSVFDAIEGAKESDYIQQCMQELSEVQRHVVHLTFFEELSYPEISNIIDCPEGTVKTRMLHAKKKLKQCLARLLNRINEK